MERPIPDPLTIEHLRRDPDLIYAVQAHGRRMRTVECGQLFAELFRRIRSRTPVLVIPRAERRSYRLRTS